VWAKVKNEGCQDVTISTVLTSTQTGGTPTLADVSVPALDVGEEFVTSVTTLTFPNPGSYYVCFTADGTFLVNPEISESNNTACRWIEVLPNLPDITPFSGPGGNVYDCQPTTPSFTIRNTGGVATGPFDCEIIIEKDNVYVTTISHSVPDIGPLGYYSFDIAWTYSSEGVYEFEIQCDIDVLLGGAVEELFEDNNVGDYSVNVIGCKPEFNFSCNDINVEPVDPVDGATHTYELLVTNSGNDVATAPIKVLIERTDGYSTLLSHPTDLNPGESTWLSVDVIGVGSGTDTLTAIIDPFDDIDEIIEGNNSGTAALCWDFEPVEKCVPDFWEFSYVLNDQVVPSVGVRSHHVYDASEVDVNFTVETPGSMVIDLGNATLFDAEHTCGCPQAVSLPVGFVFNEIGTYTFTITVDPDDEYSVECNENNNVLVVTVDIIGIPDLRVLSEFINPSELNPDLDENVTIDVTYENIGFENLGEQFDVDLMVDEIVLETQTAPGLITGDNHTINFAALWSSDIAGAHVIRAVVDAGDDVTEADELNNEATRAIIVGAACNLFPDPFVADDYSPSVQDVINLTATIVNSGEVESDADVEFYYTNDQQELVFVTSMPVSVDGYSSTDVSVPWIVLDNSTTILVQIVNSTTLEFNYDDNSAELALGSYTVAISSQPACNGDESGQLNADPVGGQPPFTFLWDDGTNGPVFTGSPGEYSLQVADNTGLIVNASGIIGNDSGVAYYSDADDDGFGNPLVSEISCDGPPLGFVTDNTDCDDSDFDVNPAATEVCNGRL
jgi:subtilase family serine protease